MPKPSLNLWDGYGLSGAAAVASQSANSEFRVRNKAREYTRVEAQAWILEHKVRRAKAAADLEECHEEFYRLVNNTAKAEIACDEDGISS